MQLMAESTFANDELSRVSPVQAINAVGPRYPILNTEIARFVRAIVKEPSFSHHTIRDQFQGAKDILIGTIDNNR